MRPLATVCRSVVDAIEAGDLDAARKASDGVQLLDVPVQWGPELMHDLACLSGAAIAVQRAEVSEPVKGSLFKRMRTVKRTSTRAAMETRFAARAVMGLRDASLPAEVEAIVAYVHGAGGVLPASSSPAVDVVRAVSAVEGTLLPASEPATLEWLRRVVALPASSESARAVHAYAQQQLSAAAGAIEGMDAWHDRTEADHDHADETAAGRAPKSLLDFARIVLAERGSRLP